MTPNLEKPQFEIVDGPEYSDMILDDIRFHGNELSNPKGWHPELVRASKLHKNIRVYSNQTKIYRIPDGKTILEYRFPLSEKQLKTYKEATKSGKGFKLYVQKEGVLISFDSSIRERVAANNKKAGVELNKIPPDFFAKLYTFDIVDGVAILKVVIK